MPAATFVRTADSLHCSG